MGPGRKYNPNKNHDDTQEDEKTSKVKKVTITEESESNVADAEPTKAVDTFKQVKERKEEEEEPETATTDDDRYKAASG
jgi:hypothetical protein